MTFEDGREGKIQAEMAIMSVEGAGGGIEEGELTVWISQTQSQAAGDGSFVTPDGRTIGPPILEVEDIVVRFGGVTAIGGVSFDVRKGEIRDHRAHRRRQVAMLNVINGFYKPNEGSIHFKGETLSAMEPYYAASNGIARTFQNIALFLGMSTLDNLMTGRMLKMKTGFLSHCFYFGAAWKEELEHRERVEHVIDFLEINDIRRTPVGRLPYGLQKRVELGRALAMEPDILLLDEPMAGMNVEEKEDMSRFVIENEEFGTTVMLIEHDMGVVMDLDRVVVLDYGRKIADGSPDEVRSNQAVIDAYLGVSHD